MALVPAARFKFRCNSVSKRLDNVKEKRFVYTYEFSAVYDGSEENKHYFAYTPSGQLNVGAFKDNLFEPGKEYFIDITEAVVVAKPDIEATEV
jgi:hypothetical protein